MRNTGFTLLELLIVVSILALLAAIATPNYRDAVMKSRVAQVQMDLRNLGAALQSYRIDHNLYPRRNNNLLFFAQYLLPDLTSPVAYLGTVSVRDPFGPVEEFEPPVEDSFGPTIVRSVQLVKNSYMYTPYVSFSFLQGNPGYRREGFVMASIGPDRQDSFIVDYPFPSFYRYPGDSVRDSVYNSSNGVFSAGDIGYFGGDLPIQGLIGG